MAWGASGGMGGASLDMCTCMCMHAYAQNTKINMLGNCKWPPPWRQPCLLGGLSLHLNHLIASRMTNYNWQFGTLPFGIFWSNLDTMDLETYSRTYSGQF